MHDIVRYSLLRILLFLAALLVLWLVGLRSPLLLLLAAATVSMALSLILLSGMRERMSAEVADSVDRRRVKAARQRERNDPSDEDIEDGLVGDSDPYR